MNQLISLVLMQITLAAMEKKQEKAWYHHYVMDWEWWTWLVRNGLGFIMWKKINPGLLTIFSTAVK